MKLKKIKYIIFLVIILVAVFGLFQYLYYKNQEKIYWNNFQKPLVENLTENRFENKKIENAVVRYLLSEKYFSWKTRENSHNFCMIENLNPSEELFPLYIWAYCGEYIIQDNELKNLSGLSVPVKINYSNELSYYDLREFSFEVPGDGSGYTEDVKKIFPEEIQQKIFNHEIKNLIERTESFAFTNILSWNIIKQGIADCKIKSVMQTHSLQVTANFKDGRVLIAQEPEIDDIFDIINQYKDKCGRIIMGTE